MAKLKHVFLRRIEFLRSTWNEGSNIVETREHSSIRAS